MNPCPNCGGELTFDIATQMLKCPFCEGVFSPAQVAAGKAAEEAHYNAQTAPPVEEGIAGDATAVYGQQPQMQPQSAVQQGWDQSGQMPQPGQMPPQGAYAQPQSGAAMAAGAFAAQPGQQAQPQAAFQGAFAQQAMPEPESFDVIAYTCPQCGGSIYSTEESVNGFCSYCGSSLMLQSRMAKMPQPKKILPFRIDKNACKESYKKFVGRSFFTPKEFKDEQALEKFRGIYMPYWIYDMSMSGEVNLKGTKSYRRGNYVYTEHYRCIANVDSYYRGLSYDASSSFDDHFSEGIAPFDAHSMIDFNENYMAGYYADMQDVSNQVYVSDAGSFVQDQIFNNVKSGRCFPGISIDSTQKSRISPRLDPGAPYLAFLPVWFLSYRKNDRVAYAVVNGQTGKIVSDLPVDNKKFLMVAGILAVIIYIVLAFMPAMTPTNTLTVSMVISLISVLMLNITIGKVKKRDQRLDDKGYLSKYNAAEYRKTQVKKHTEGGKTAKNMIMLIPIIFIFGAHIGFSIIGFLIAAFGMKLIMLGAVLAMFGLTIYGFSGLSSQKTQSGGNKGPLTIGFICMIVVSAYALILSMVRPPSDLWYYSGTFALMAATVYCQILVLGEYNLLTTHPLPQLNRKGGNDSAY
ncbi:MAG: hypothetical protein IJM34_12005 [Lachnospiraceae bacterium]|nr:hypothetical protein [Lachnospiraceae bacterium]